jgi:hypothetical protein
LACHLDGPLNEPSIHVRLDEPLSESHQSPFAERGLLSIQTIKHQLPPPIHECGLNHFIIRDTCVRLENGRQGQLCWRNGRVPTLTGSIECCEFFLKGVIKESVSVMAKKDK